jgi:asparagine synthase (glutamine-hydrolysing)
MCGIYGCYSKQPINRLQMQAATATLSHRGPDAEGFFIDDEQHLFLGHRRLSIIDLSSEANQPMHSLNKRFIIVYNGEIYNYKDLKGRLGAHDWQTHGDTEVIVELFRKFGAESFAWLNGIFAFSIYDNIEKKLWLCRDQLGIKPLFVTRDEKGLSFGSELKSIISGSYEKGLLPLINHEAIPYFLHLGYIPEPLTIYEGIEKFPAGHYASLDLLTNEWNVCKYWNAGDHYLTNETGNADNYSLYKEKLFEAVEKQMVSDVSIGSFLSGGIDSSLVTAVASKISSQPINSFSIGFEEPKFDESAYARQVAGHLHTKHHEFRVKEADVLALVPDFIDVFDEPFADSSAFPTMLVSKLARGEVTVCLSGDGGDELFQGYGMYEWANRLNKTSTKIFRKPLGWVTGFMNERYQRGGKLFLYPDENRIASHIFSQEQYFFSETELDELLSLPSFDFAELNNLPGRGSAGEQQAFFDLGRYLKDDLLVKVDRASMHYSLEARVPLLDKDLVEFALKLPLAFKTNKVYGAKYLMKKTLFEMVPEAMFDRPKRGFSIPMDKWLRNELRYLIDSYLSEENVNSFGVVKFTYVENLLADFFSGKTFLYNRVWVLLVLHWWYKLNPIRFNY